MQFDFFLIYAFEFSLDICCQIHVFKKSGNVKRAIGIEIKKMYMLQLLTSVANLPGNIKNGATYK